MHVRQHQCNGTPARHEKRIVHSGYIQVGLHGLPFGYRCTSTPRTREYHSYQGSFYDTKWWGNSSPAPFIAPSVDYACPPIKRPSDSGNFLSLSYLKYLYISFYGLYQYFKSAFESLLICRFCIFLNCPFLKCPSSEKSF